jgi:hypothetical protein
MKIDLSKYPPGTKFKLKNGETVVLVGKSHISDDYLIEHIRDSYHIPDCPAVTYRRQNGTAAASTGKYDIESVIQPDKYLVIYQNHALEIHNIVIVDPKSPTEDDLYQQIWIKKEGHQRPKKILSWVKIEE